ncbi:MAG: hypothetical protein M1453_13905 [Acidobacteria bacterium]|nr:hypothetical protein [Acidobacteriota bacterium]MCL5289074.1 hypothetical protein [Acidobacteriota bacterium]
MWAYLIAPLLSLLPRRWRLAMFGEVGFNWPRATFLSGLVEAVGFFGGLIAWYFHTMYSAVHAQMGVTLEATKGVPGEGAAYGMGVAALATFALHPLTWVLGYFTLEGIWRMLAAALTEESPGTLPLVIVAWITGGIGRRAYEARVPLVADQVTRGGEKDAWALCVASCRPKPDWIYPLTIRYLDEYFQVTGEAAAGATPARPHVYLLNRPPAGEAFRGVREYDPEAQLRAPEEAPNFLLQYFRERAERWRLERLPAAPDLVERGDGAQGWHLRVQSVREKPGWAPGRTIRFEEQMFRINENYRGSAERPFGYRMRKLFENEAARGVMDYWPE